MEKTALLSVFDKTGLLDLAQGLRKSGFRLLASGGTSKALKEAGFEVGDVESVTKSPEMLGGRVKTLHPAVHGGILARDIDADNEDLAKQQISKIDVVVVNLYPFEKVISQPSVTTEEAIENIDIGGVALLRAAAKNHQRVLVLSSPSQYWDFLEEQKQGNISQDTRNRLALEAFETTAGYDEAISDYFRKKYASDGVQHLSLRYGCNPHQKPASAFVQSPSGKLPFTTLNGSPGYINLLDALNAWQLVKELRAALGYAAAASFKHVSPAGAAIGVPLTQLEKQVYFVEDITGLDQSQLACAYARARGADRMSSYGDMIALSDEVDVPTAKIISREVSDGVIAPGYSPEALKILSAKKGGKFLLLQISPEFEPASSLEYRTLFGVTLSQNRNDANITPALFKSTKQLPDSALRDLTVVTLATKYTQSNSVGYGLNGQVIGLGAGGQSRIGMTRQAGDKADNWWMRFHERALHLKWKKGVKRADKANAIDMLCGGHVPEDGPERDDWEGKFEEVPPLFTQEERRQWLSKLSEVACSSDAFFPFTDNVYRACRSGAKYIAAPLGSQADELVKAAAEQLGAVFIEQPTRLFHH